ncbi:MAG: hypothetical protein ACTSP9_12515 [Promethearchaeota archaeon]
MAENKISLFSIIALIIGAFGLGVGVFSVVNFQVLEGPPGQDGLDGLDGVDGQTNNTGIQVIEPITYLPAINTGATLNHIWIELNAIDEYMYATFFANSDVVDTSKDIIFRFIMDCTQTDESLQMLKYGAHTRTDNTTIFSWNIDDGVAISFNTTAQVMFIYEYIFDAVNVEDGDWLSFALKLNEATRNVGIMYAEVEYIHI